MVAGFNMFQPMVGWIINIWICCWDPVGPGCNAPSGRCLFPWWSGFVSSHAGSWQRETNWTGGWGHVLSIKPWGFGKLPLLPLNRLNHAILVANDSEAYPFQAQLRSRNQQMWWASQLQLLKHTSSYGLEFKHLNIFVALTFCPWHFLGVLDNAWPVWSGPPGNYENSHTDA